VSHQVEFSICPEKGAAATAVVATAAPTAAPDELQYFLKTTRQPNLIQKQY